MAHTPPRTIMEVYESLPEGTLAEVIDDTLVMSPAPNRDHQTVLGDIFLSMASKAKAERLGKVFVAPFGVYLDSTNVVQPDIMFVSAHRMDIVQHRGIVGAPDLLIEVLSPSNIKHDRVVKLALYERFGVQEYWIIDPVERIVEGYALSAGAYVSLPKTEGYLESPLLRDRFEF